MIGPIVALAVGLGVLAVAADQFVLGAARLARLLNVPAVVVGVVVIGFGTSLPEVLVSVGAARQGEMEVAAANALGSNLANLTLLLGIGAIVTPIVVVSGVVRRELPMTVVVTLGAWLAVQNGLTRAEGIALLLGLTIAIALTLAGAFGAGDDDPLGPEADELTDSNGLRAGGAAARAAGGLVGTLIASQLVLRGALGLADALDLAAGFVGATVVAIGTSLPELVTVIQSARRKEPDLIVGNLLGSNVFNATGVLGLAAVAAPGPILSSTVPVVAGGMMMVATVAASLAMVTGRAITRREGLGLVGGWLVAAVALA